MADSNVASAATAFEPMRKPGRPTGSGSIMTKTAKFDIGATVDELTYIASGAPWYWDWDASDYPANDWDLSEVPPIMSAMNKYSKLLIVFIRLARYD